MTYILQNSTYILTWFISIMDTSHLVYISLNIYDNYDCCLFITTDFSLFWQCSCKLFFRSPLCSTLKGAKLRLDRRKIRNSQNSVLALSISQNSLILYIMMMSVYSSLCFNTAVGGHVYVCDFWKLAADGGITKNRASEQRTRRRQPKPIYICIYIIMHICLASIKPKRTHAHMYDVCACVWCAKFWNHIWDFLFFQHLTWYLIWRIFMDRYYTLVPFWYYYKICFDFCSDIILVFLWWIIFIIWMWLFDSFLWTKFWHVSVFLHPTAR